MKRRAYLNVPLFLIMALAATLLCGCQWLPAGDDEHDLIRRPYEPVRALPTPKPRLQPTPTPKPVVKKADEKKERRGWNLFSRKKATPTPEIVVSTPVKPLPFPTRRITAPRSERPAVATPAPVRTQTVQAYRFKASDPIIIILEGPGGLSERVEDVVDERGNVKLKYVGDVRAAGKTATMLERDVERTYIDEGIYKSLTARVLVPNRAYTIGGEVRSPGRFTIVGKVTLSQAISVAGNFTEWANERKVELVRDNKKTVIDFREIRDRTGEDIELRAGDIITVRRRRI